MMEEEAADLDNHYSARYLALVARANYLAQDRPDIQFATQELCREMSQPKVRSWNNLKRLGRCLQANPRYVQEYRRQTRQADISTWVDTDYAGCIRTRKSTSGGMICLGSHFLKGWSATQKPIALSSGEAEYYGLAKGSAMGKNVLNL